MPDLAKVVVDGLRIPLLMENKEMEQISSGNLLWQPTVENIANANLTNYQKWLAREKDLHFATYQELWQWSVDHPADFWASLFPYFDLTYSRSWTEVLPERIMPGTRWFVGAELNYAENIFAKRTAERPMMLFKAEDKPLVEISLEEVLEQTKRLSQALRDTGVGRGDRVVAYLPNIPEAIIAMLATASLGAIWSSCSPDFGSRSVLDRFAQIEPKVLIAVDGYRYGGKLFNRVEIVAELQAGLPTLEQTILVPEIGVNQQALVDTIQWQDALSPENASEELSFEQVAFDHPLWVLYSSGTTGLPKPIVHGHGGILLELVKETVFHNNLHAGDRFFWYTSTGWMMWNYMVGALLSGSTIVLYNGSPGYPDLNALFELAETAGMSYFGTSAAFISACMKAGIRPNQRYDLHQVRSVGSTGSPLTAEGFHWVYENINQQLLLESLSGGTDLCTPFVGGVPTQPVYAGEIQGASLGAKVQAFNEVGEPVLNEVGELVIAEPMPSMPLYFWGDPDMVRYKASYFEIYPGIWRHGDWISFNERGGCVIYGRSDSTINRMGIRMGTSEFYRIVEAFDEIADSLIVDMELLGRESYLPLFVVLRPGTTLDDELREAISRQLRQEVSPRHVPNEIIAIDAVPYTLSGKKMEVPIRKILLGEDVETAANPGAMRNPESLEFFVQYAKQLSFVSQAG
jgi:acetoacetyl-CoA synthetase